MVGEDLRMDQTGKNNSYSQVACIGAGLSAIALGATLKRWYKNDQVRFFERHEESGGTWAINSYPGMHFAPSTPVLYLHSRN